MDALAQLRWLARSTFRLTLEQAKVLKSQTNRMRATNSVNSHHDLSIYIVVQVPPKNAELQYLTRPPTVINSNHTQQDIRNVGRRRLGSDHSQRDGESLCSFVEQIPSDMQSETRLQVSCMSTRAGACVAGQGVLLIEIY